MLTVERILFFALVISPLVGLAMILLKGFSGTYNNRNNDASYYSGWVLITLFGFFFDIISYINTSQGDYASSLIKSWNFLSEISWFLYFGLFVGCVWGLSTMKTSKEDEAVSEVGKFLIKAIGTTAGAFVLLVLFNTIAPIASQIN